MEEDRDAAEKLNAGTLEAFEIKRKGNALILQDRLPNGWR
jgi:hypothetical protein